MTTLPRFLHCCAAAVALGLFAGCATADQTPDPTSEPLTKALAPGDAAWLKTRERHYRSLGWSSLDAQYQAEQDLERGKSSPVEQPHHGRRIPN